VHRVLVIARAGTKEQRAVTVSLWIPVEEAVDRNIDTLVETFSDLAEQAGGELVDDSETMGIWQWFQFGGLTTGQVRDIAARIIPNHREITFADRAPDDDEWKGDHVILVT
jgi:hypothetical protein